MTDFICTACGTEFPPADAPPAICPICADARQFIPAGGQSWTTIAALAAAHWNGFRRVAPDLYAFGTFPHFAIGQRAFLLRTPAGNVLWDCVSLIDDATIDLLHGMGGIAAIAISHPHYYTTMGRWAAAFDAPVHLHAADREWVQRPDPRLRFWDGDTLKLLPGVTLIRAGGHFSGGTVLHAAEGKGAILSGDILQVGPDRKLAFMWSYPNYVPLGAGPVRTIAERLAPFVFDAIWGAFWDREIVAGGRAILEESVHRHLRAIAM